MPLAIAPLEWKSGQLWVLDQTLLPLKEKWIRLRDVGAAWEAIRSLRVRGAPLIGVVAGYAVVVAAQSAPKPSFAAFRRRVLKDIDYLASSRPTAVNLFWALNRMRRMLDEDFLGAKDALHALEQEAKAIHEEDIEAGRKIGDFGAALLKGRCNILTHCNAGALATSYYGTALAPVYRAWENGNKKLHVFVDETRPLLQGARLTAWELMKARIPATLLCDNTAGVVFSKGRVQAVIVGADRIAANGDTANKIGTYTVAVLAHRHKVPFYVAAPLSTIDRNIAGGKSIPIEERASEEITMGFGRRTAPYNVKTFSPAFDVTPAALISAIITEAGVLKPPYLRSIAKAFRRAR